MARLAAATFLALLSYASATCFAGCRFRFCTYATAEFAVGSEPGRPFSGTLCSASDAPRLGKVHAFGEAVLINPPAAPTAISQWQAPGLLQPFAPNVFKPFDFVGTPYSGVTHEILQRNQNMYLNATCWALPLAAYQIIDGNATVIANVNAGNNTLVECVALKTFTF